MPNLTICKVGKALYRGEAVKKYGAEIVDATKPIKEFGARWKGKINRVYLVSDLEAAKVWRISLFPATNS